MDYELTHTSHRTLSNGRFYPLGATVEEDGVNFALYSKHAKAVYLLLFDAPDGPPTDIIQLQAHTREIWHVLVHGVGAGQYYGYKVDGEYNPGYGFRYNRNKLLIDPYAKALSGKLVNQDNLLLGYDMHSPERDVSFDCRDNTFLVPKCVVIDDNDFDWQGDRHPDIPSYRTIIYEVHVKGFTAHASSGVRYPGTYAGFEEKIPYLKDLGITAVELLPLHEHYTEDFLLQKNLTNYWGYNTLCYFAPESSYAHACTPGGQVNEFKKLVRSLHKAGIEVILDVVFNHTCEGNELGPTVCYRGIDNLTYYSLSGGPDAPRRYYKDYSGCGNSLDVSNRPVLRLVMDSLRYWVEVMHVDGFRFDLASVLGREEDRFQNTASFFDAVSQDPVLSRIKLIAEPWDIKTYQVGNFPIDWCEWNGRFRDVIRKFVKGDSGQMAELGSRIFGSQDIYGNTGRVAFNSINFVTCHDGFTLYDLVSFNAKHNEANGEQNRDGANDNNAWNCGVEGNTKDPMLSHLRKQQIKNFVSYLLVSGGTPMLLGGDEWCRTQAGNNNAYCQDNNLSWFNWALLEEHRDTHRFFKKLIFLVLRYRSSRIGNHTYGNVLPPRVQWYGSEGNAPSWNDPESRTLCLWMPFFETGALQEDYFIIFHAAARAQWVCLSPLPAGRIWYRIIDTSLESPFDIVDPQEAIVLDRQDKYHVQARSVVLLLGKKEGCDGRRKQKSSSRKSGNV